MKPQHTASQFSAERVRQQIQMRFDPLPQLTPELLVQYHAEFRAGTLRNAAIMWEQIAQVDDKAAIVIAKREKAAARHGLEFVVSEGHEKDARAEAHREALARFYDRLQATDAMDRNRRGGVRLLLRQMMRAQGNLYAVHELIWKPGRDGLTVTCQYVPLCFFENRTGALRFLVNDWAWDGIELEPDGWMVTCGDGLMAATSICYMYKRLPLRDWLIYCSKHGVPFPHATTTAQEGSAEWVTLETAVRNMGIDMGLVTSEGVKINPIDIGVRGDLPYPALIDRMDRAIVSLWRGGDLSTLSGGADSTGASLQGEEGDILEQEDAEMLTESLNEQLDRPFIRYTFGEEPLAWARVKTGQRTDVDADLKVDQFLHGAGWPLSLEALAQRYNRALPGDDETLLPPRAQAVPATLESLANDADSAAAALDESLARRAEAMAPVAALVAELERKAADPAIDDEALVAFIEEQLAEFPGLLEEIDLASLSAPLAAALGASAAAGVAQALEEGAQS